MYNFCFCIPHKNDKRGIIYSSQEIHDMRDLNEEETGYTGQSLKSEAENLSVDSVVRISGTVITTKYLALGWNLSSFCKHKSSYVWNMFIYTGKDTEIISKIQGIGMSQFSETTKNSVHAARKMSETGIYDWTG